MSSSRPQAAYAALSNPVTLLTAIAVLFHVVGLVGIFAGIDAIIRATPLHLLLMTGLLIVSLWQQKRWMLWALIAGGAGFIAEWIGVHTSALFGHYKYGTALGPAVDEIPLLIAANWIIVVSGATSLAQGFAKKKATIPIIAALIATACDWLLEPVAIRLGWWSWEGGTIPFLNYLCWAGLSFLLSLLWVALKIRPGAFAVILFLVQCMFFALLRLAI